MSCEKNNKRKMKKNIKNLLARLSIHKPKAHDFEKVSETLEKYHVNLSSRSLKKLWGYLTGKEKPSQETLDRIALFAGFQKWEDLQTTLHGDSDGQINYE